MTRPKIARHVLRQFEDFASMGKALETVAAPLTTRETQILNYIANGNTNKQIAAVLQISEQTIKNHVSAILRKLNANDRAHAVVLAIRHGWISIQAKEAQPAAIS
jgi:DNA-binding NarL/FixJ family response regulator